MGLIKPIHSGLAEGMTLLNPFALLLLIDLG